MGWIKDVGGIVGTVAGVVVGGPIYLAGTIVNSDLLKEIGDGACNVTARTGELLGNVTEGVADVISGTVNSDKKKQSDGMGKIIDSGASYAKGIVKGTLHVAKNGIETVDAIIDGDTDKAIKTGKELVKVAAVSALAIGVADVIDGLDVFDDVDDFDDNDILIENENIHHVTPHERVLPDGRTIWVDGDGDTSVDTYDGWYQSNPDYRV